MALAVLRWSHDYTHFTGFWSELGEDPLPCRIDKLGSAGISLLLQSGSSIGLKPKATRPA